MGEARALLCQALVFTLAGRERFQLRELVRGEIDASVTVAGLTFELERAVEQRVPHTVRDPDLLREGDVAAVSVQQLALCGAARERLEFVLAVDVDEEAAGVAQQLHRNA